MKFEYLKGGEKDFYSASDDDVYVFRCFGSTFFSRDLHHTSCGQRILESDYDYIIAERRPIAEPKASAEWNGEGLPPVGVECEMSYAGHEWMNCVLIAHGDEQIIFKLDGCREFSGHRNNYKFRPIRSPQEIARDEAINGMAEIIEYRNGCSPKPLAGWLYDAGYRKLE